MRSTIGRVVRHFLKTTTLHGFKYLSSPYRVDRLWWAFCCCASACCAGLLCSALWSRFLQLPALLALRDGPRLPTAPLVAVCHHPHRAAQFFLQHITLTDAQRILMPTFFENLLRGRMMNGDNLLFVDKLLKSNNLTLREALMKTTPQCGALTRKCRWIGRKISCSQIFKKELTQYGACCIAKQDAFVSNFNPINYRNNPQLDLLLQCSDGMIENGCEFYTKYVGEEWVYPVTLSSGSWYTAKLQYTNVLDAATDRLLDTNCISRDDYSRKKCLIQCKELKCGCSEPLRSISWYERGVPPPCEVRQLNCLRRFKLIDESCQCPALCKKILTVTSVMASPINEIANTLDPIYADVNATSSTMLSIRIVATGSKVFDLIYNETWWSLLSSLGGVFSMFLGVGLFSALEILFVILVKLPIAIKQSSEMTTNVVNVR